MKKQLIIVPPVYDDQQACAYADVYLHNRDLHKFHDDVVFVSNIIPHEEVEFMTGLYPPTRDYFEVHLPFFRHHLLKVAKRHEDIVIFSGSELGSLWSAYYLQKAGIAYHLIITNAQFMGGQSDWVRVHPLMLNHLVTSALKYAKSVEIAGEGFTELPAAFPRIKREYKRSVLTICESLRTSQTQRPDTAAEEEEAGDPLRSLGDED